MINVFGKMENFNIEWHKEASHFETSRDSSKQLVVIMD